MKGNLRKDLAHAAQLGSLVNLKLLRLIILAVATFLDMESLGRDVDRMSGVCARRKSREEEEGSTEGREIREARLRREFASESAKDFFVIGSLYRSTDSLKSYDNINLMNIDLNKTLLYKWYILLSTTIEFFFHI